MGKLRNHKRIALWLGIVLVVSLVVGCAGIAPYEPRDDREEGPEKGLFTGSEGEFVIFRKADAPEADSAGSVKPKGTIEDEEKKTKINGGE